MASSSSTVFSPLNWECPKCNKSYSSLNNITFIRGTCLHDICSNCITTLVNEFKLTKRKTTRKVAAYASLIDIPCPLVGCSRGRFLVTKGSSGVNVKSEKNANQEIIDVDLLSSDDEVEDKKPSSIKDIKQVVPIKKEVKKEEHTTSPSKRAASIKKEETPTPKQRQPEVSVKKEKSPSGASSNTKIVTPSPVKKKSQLKPRFDVGDEVYAEFLPNSWYPGKVKSYKEVESDSKYGPIRFYDIIFDDGDEKAKVEDYKVMAKRDYELTSRRKHNEYMGVKICTDGKSIDRWARDVGWYEVNIDGTTQLYSFLSDAMKVHDAYVVRTKGNQVEKSELNIPQDYSWLFENEKKPYIKPEVKGEDTDDDSRFSGGEDESVVKPPQNKRMRLASSDVDTDSDCQLVSAAQFTKEAFMGKPLFHLNPFTIMNSTSLKRENKGFGLFIKEGVATPGYEAVPRVVSQQLGVLTQSELRKAIIENDCWLTWEDQDEKDKCRPRMNRGKTCKLVSQPQNYLSVCQVSSSTFILPTSYPVLVTQIYK